MRLAEIRTLLKESLVATYHIFVRCCVWGGVRVAVTFKNIKFGVVQVRIAVLMHHTIPRTQKAAPIIHLLKKERRKRGKWEDGTR